MTPGGCWSGCRQSSRTRGPELILVTHGGVVRTATAPEDPRQGVPVPRRPVANATVATLHREAGSNTGAR